MNILIFGAGDNGRVLCRYIEQYSNDRIIGFVDNNSDLKLGGYKRYRVEEIIKLHYDYIIISVSNSDSIRQIQNQLHSIGVNDNKIKVLMQDDLRVKVFSSINRYDEYNDARVSWIRAFAKYVYGEHITGNVAECGVNRGELSEYINKYYPDRLLYLFDTFEGFDLKDVDYERTLNDHNFTHGSFNNTAEFHTTSVEIVKNRMPHIENCRIKQGYFPDTAKDVDDKFCFVNLDMDLYKPMKAGLEFFYTKMVHGGCILMHDYFHPELPGVRKAIGDYEKEHGISLCKVPIGDYCSIAIIKHDMI